MKKVFYLALVLSFAFNMVFNVLSVSALGGIFASGNGADIGEDMEITVSLSADTDMYSYELYIDYDGKALEFVSCTAANNPQNESIKIVCDGNGTKANEFKVVFKGKTVGITEVSLRDFSYVDSSLTKKTLPGDKILVSVGTGVSGDVNFDGELNILDLMRLKKYTGYLSDEMSFSGADVNKDGNINASDLTALKKLILQN